MSNQKKPVNNNRVVVPGVWNDLQEAFLSCVDDRSSGLFNVATTAFSRVEMQTVDGRFFSGSTNRIGVTVDTALDYVIRTGNNYMSLEQVGSLIDFANLGSGTFVEETNFYMSGSNRNTWSYGAGGTLVPAGIPMNCEFINNDPDTQLLVAPTNVVITGVEDFRLQFTQTYIDTQGNRNSISSADGNFFTGDRYIIIPPNSEALITSRTSGTALGTINIKSQYFFSELPV